MIRVFETPQAAYAAAAWQWMRAALDTSPGLIGVATGTTTTPVHAVVVKLFGEASFDTEPIAICAVDDYIGIPAGHIASCGERVRAQLVRPLGLRAENAVLPDRFDGDAAGYEAEIARRGGIKMQMLGLGGDGHIGFNYPGTPLGTAAHRVPLPQTTRDTLARLYALPAEDMPSEGLTLGIRSIMMSGRIVVIATGSGKAEAVRAALRGPVTEKMPASVLQLHRDVLWLLDGAAAALL